LATNIYRLESFRIIELQNIMTSIILLFYVLFQTIGGGVRDFWDFRGFLSFSEAYPRNLLVAFKFSNSHFHIQNCRFRALFCRFTTNQADIQRKYDRFDVHHPLLHSENDVSCISTEKAFIKMSKKQPFSAHSTRLLTL
jgi:hypothetical protein